MLVVSLCRLSSPSPSFKTACTQATGYYKLQSGLNLFAGLIDYEILPDCVRYELWIEHTV